MLTDPQLRSQVDDLWNTFWAGGLNNPLDAIEQFSYLLFLKRLDDEENTREAQSRRRNQEFKPRLPDEIRWRHWSQMTGSDMLKYVREVVFPFLKKMGDEDDKDDENTDDENDVSNEIKENSFARYMQNAEFKINKASLLVEAVKKIDEMKISQQNQDVQGDLYEYMLSHLSTAGRNGQFRTPRHIIRMMVRMLDPKPGERIGDLAAGTCGFPVNAYQYILAEHTSPNLHPYDENGDIINPIGDQLDEAQRQFLQNGAIRAYDSDSGMTMLRIGSMNLMLHGVERPRFFYTDTLSTSYDEPNDYDVILMNPPFKGAIDKNDMHENLKTAATTKTELLFLWRILRALDMGGRVAVIVPDGVLFGSSGAHIAIRKKIVEENRLDGVISMPSGVFKPYADVSTAVLLFTRGGTTDDIFFYDMAYDGFTLDDKRTPTPYQNDIPDVIACWENRRNPAFLQARDERLTQLHEQIAPLHTRRLELERDIHRLKFEAAIAESGDPMPHETLQREQMLLDRMFAELNPLKAETDQLTRFFWVNKQQVKANKYDLSTSRYRQIERDEVFYEDPRVTVERIKTLEKYVADGMDRILGRLK